MCWLSAFLEPDRPVSMQGRKLPEPGGVSAGGSRAADELFIARQRDISRQTYDADQQQYDQVDDSAAAHRSNPVPNKCVF